MSSDTDFDCRHFRGDKPCQYSGKRYCGPRGRLPCGHYEPLGPLTLVIKLGALGDVLRTTTLLPAIERVRPDGCVAWITQPAAIPLLEGAGLWKTLPWGFEAVLWAEGIEWHHVICLDKEEAPTALAGRLRSELYSGFGRNRHGLLRSLSAATNDLFRLGIDDEIKFCTNKKTYPHLIAEACELTWGPNPYVLNLTKDEHLWAAKLVASWGTRPLIGLNPGAGEAFAGKQWPLENFVELAKRLDRAGFTPVFLGGARESSLYKKLQEVGDVPGVFPGCDFSLRQFISIVSRLTVMVAGDTLAMHIGIARGVYQVTLFGSTTDREIDFYGRGEAIVGKASCAPCYRRICPTREECMREISDEKVFEAVLRGTGCMEGKSR
ncbi:MAG: glycosyltransferase family 9 protein [Candidatus Riflebacteria bacterium]|nr:glycosyltransferase family 9 protein [Candidatus Riflebacteria bacterium]